MGRKIQKLTEEEWSELNNGSLGTTTSQTSIEWLIEQMLMKGYFDKNVTFTNIDHLQHQAKEMHKQEIIDACNKSIKICGMGHIFPKYSDKYYQETFVSKGSDEVELSKHPSVISENGNELFFDKEGNLIKELPKQKETLYTEEQVIGFAQWISGKYSYGNILGKWYLHENTDKNYTGKELFDLYIQSLKQPKQ